MEEEILNIKNLALGQIWEAKTPADIERIQLEFLGKKGQLTLLIKQLAKLPPHQRKQAGIITNEAKKTISEACNNQRENISKTHGVTKEFFDPTIPGNSIKVGHLHPTTLVIEQMTEIFKHLGFSQLEGPEIETDIYNFEMLNLPKDHPARSLQDVLYLVEPDILLRSHTSSVETRGLATLDAPFRFVVAGKCYRYENVNATNNAMFYQFQGVALQEGLSMSDLKGTLYYFIKSFFGKDREIRFRCKYYPEVEPGAGVDLDCQFCNKKGCSVCKGRGWIEMLGCGMIHPNILKKFGYNPAKISGFAFGMGLDRMVMDKFKIKDIRSLYNGDIAYQL